MVEKKHSKREIFYCNLKVEVKGKIHILKKVVYKETDDKFYKNKRVLSSNGIKDPAKIISFEIIKSLGFENSSTGFNTGTKKKMDSFRNE